MAQKLYRIGDAAELLGLETHVLRYWEAEFPQLRPVRTGKGQRRYTEADMAMLDRIRCLRDQGLTIEGARRVLAGECTFSLNTPHAADLEPVLPVAAAPEPPAKVPPFFALVPDTPPKPKRHMQPPREKRPGRQVQLFLEARLGGAEHGQPAACRDDAGHSETIRHIADELRDLLRLLRQN